MSIDPNQLVQRGMTAHQSGNLPEAERLYREALAANPNHFEGLHSLGLAVALRGDPEEGERLMRRSLEVNASKPEAFKNHALMLNSLRRHQESIEACDAALALAPRMADAMIVRCNALRELDPLRGGADLARSRDRDPAEQLHRARGTRRYPLSARSPRRSDRLLEPRARDQSKLRAGDLQPRLPLAGEGKAR